jgi:hypothetical protein
MPPLWVMVLVYIVLSPYSSSALTRRGCGEPLWQTSDRGWRHPHEQESQIKTETALGGATGCRAVRVRSEAGCRPAPGMRVLGRAPGIPEGG